MPREADPKAIRICGGGATGLVAIRAAADGQKLRAFTMLAYTGAPMYPEGWWDPVIIDLAGVKVPSQQRPILRQHDHEKIVGHSTAVVVSDKGIEITGVMSGVGPDATEVIALADNGFPWQASIGATPIRREYLDAGKTATVNGREVTGPMVISRETELGESSFVPLGADGATSATVSGSLGRRTVNERELLKGAKRYGNVRAAKYSDEDIEKMSDEEAKAALKECMKNADDEPADKDKKPEAKAGDEPDGDEAKAKAAARARIEASRRAEAAEVERVDGIKAACREADVTSATVNNKKVSLAAHAISAGWTVDQTRQQIELEQLRARRPAAGTGGPTVYVPSKPELNEAVLEAGCLHAMRHSLRLEDDSFYTETTPDGKGTTRRVPLHLQRQIQGDIRARYTDQVQQAAHTLFKGRVTLKQVLALAAQAAGLGRDFDLSGEHGVRDFLAAWGHSQIRADGASTLSISNVLANVMNKSALQGYLFTEQAWRGVAGIRPVNDFKPTKAINLLGDVQYKKLGPTGELESAALGDQAFANQAEPYGRIATIPWTHIVNDDLGILQTVPQKIGQGAGLALNDVFWTLWKAMAAGTVNGDDGNAFWRTTSATAAANVKAGTAYKPNKTSGGTTALSAASLQTVKALFDNQIDPNGNPLGFDGVKPVLLFGPSNWQTAMNLLYASAIVYGGGAAALQPNNNIWAGYFEPVMSRYIEAANYVNSATAWWMLFNPAALAVIEVSFLNGVDTPAVLQAGPDFQFDKLGISIRGTMPFGVSQQNFRGGVYSVGA